VSRWQDSLIVRDLGRADYRTTWEAMRAQTTTRDKETPDEFWLVEHAPVYTLGLKGPAATETMHAGIPVIKTDRGGDITYHGPGQAVIYLLIDLRRRGLAVRQLVCLMEDAVLELLERYAVFGARRDGAPGIYVKGEKIASLGLRVRRGCTYHGLALNIDMDLAPFRRIKPCGLEGVAATQLSNLVANTNTDNVRQQLVRSLADTLGYSCPDIVHAPRERRSA